MLSSCERKPEKFSRKQDKHSGSHACAWAAIFYIFFQRFSQDLLSETWRTVPRFFYINRFLGTGNLQFIIIMKKLFILSLAIIALGSCASKKAVPEVKQETITSLEGEKVRQETRQLSGITMSEALNEDGTALIQRPFKWYAGHGKADNKQMAIELAQSEAYATISRVLTNIVESQTERGNIANNGAVQQALTSYWKQVSMSIQKGCEPFGEAVIEYDPTTRMYSVTAKVGIRGDRFNALLNDAGKHEPETLAGEELQQFIDINKSIMEAAKGN